MFDREVKHRGESREVIRPIHIFLGASALVNIILVASVIDSTANSLEIKQATHDITNYLQDDGYDGVRNLTIDYIDDTFSFTISDNTNVLSCVGHYNYEDSKIKDIGQVSCAEIDLHINPSESPLLV
jgi:hypothetical protein